MKLAGICSSHVSTRLAPVSDSSHVPRSESLQALLHQLVAQQALLHQLVALPSGGVPPSFLA